MMLFLLVALIAALFAPLAVQGQPRAPGYQGGSPQGRDVEYQGEPVWVTVYAPPVLVTITRSAGDDNDLETYVVASTPSSTVAITPASLAPSSSPLAAVSTPSAAASTKAASAKPSSSPTPDQGQSSTPSQAAQTTAVPTSTKAPTSSEAPAITSSPSIVSTNGGNGGSGGPGSFTIHITNSYGSPVSIGMGWNSDGAAPDGNPQPTVLASTTSYTFPTHWAGRISVGKTLSGSNSLIEGSYQGDQWTSIDVSYVDGYSVPITCSTEGNTVTGCNVELFEQKVTCGSPVDNGAACHNTAGDYGPTLEFFSPCAGAAYTYPKDDTATYGAVPGKEVSCCIGTSCQAPPSQKKASKRDVVPSRPHGHSHHARHFDHRRSSRSHVHQLVQEAKLRR